MIERRRSERLAVQIPVLARSSEASVSGVAINLSRHGLLLLGGQTLGHKGTKVDLMVDLLEGPVAVAGEVVRTVEDGAAQGVGIRFTELAPQVRRELANYMIERHYQALA